MVDDIVWRFMVCLLVWEAFYGMAGMADMVFCGRCWRFALWAFRDVGVSRCWRFALLVFRVVGISRCWRYEITARK